MDPPTRFCSQRPLLLLCFLALLTKCMVSTSLASSRPAKWMRPGAGKRVLLQRHIPLAVSEAGDLLSDIRTMALTPTKQIVVIHDRGNQATVFGNTGAFLKAIRFEDAYGPGANKRGRFERVRATNAGKLIFLPSGFVQKYLLYDLQQDEFKLVPFDSSHQRRTSPPAFVDIASRDGKTIVLLKHPRRVLGQPGEAEVVILSDERKMKSFAAFPGLRFPRLSQHFAAWGDRVVLLDDGTICVSNPFADRIYRYDLAGRRLADLVYPEGVLQRPEEDAPQDPRRWATALKNARQSDTIKDVFPVVKSGERFYLVVRVREKSLFLDLFLEDGTFHPLGDYFARFGGENLVTIASRDEFLYVLKWPDVEPNQFSAVGNPEVAVFEVVF